MTTGFPLPGVIVDPNGKTIAVAITDSNGNTPTVYSDPFGLSPVAIPQQITARTTYYMPSEGPWKFAGLGTVTLEDAQLATLTRQSVTVNNEKLNVVERGYMVQNSGADQSTGLNAAAVAVSLANGGGGGGLFIPAGIYHLGSTTIAPPSARVCEITGEGGGGTAFPQTGVTTLLWDSDPGAGLFGSYGLDLTNVSQPRVSNLAMRGPGTGATPDGGMPTGMSGIKSTSSSIIERCGITNFAAGIAYPRADHSTIRSCYVGSCGFGVHWLPSLATGSDQHISDSLFQNFCASFAIAATAFLDGSGITDVGLFSPIGILRYDDTLGTAASSFLTNCTFGGACATEAAGTAAIFDELHANSSLGLPIDGCDFCSRFVYQAPINSQHLWSGVFSVNTSAGTSLTINISNNFLLRKGMTVVGSGVPANTTITAISGSWPWNPTAVLTVSNSVSSPTSVTIAQPQLGSIVARTITNNYFHGQLISAVSNFPYLYADLTIGGNTADDGLTALNIAVGAGGGLTGGGATRVGGNIFGNGGTIGISAERMNTGSSATQGDLLMRVTGNGLTQADGTRRPYGVALRNATTSLSVDVQRQANTLLGLYNGPLVRNLTASNIAANALVYVDATNHGGVSGTAPGSGWIYPIGVNGASIINAGTTGRLDELWL